MKRITKILMLSLAVVLAACQTEEEILSQTAPQTLTFKATIGEQTRVCYTQDDLTGNIKLSWEIGDIVKLYEGNTEKATFYLTEIDGETATFVCDDSYNIADVYSTKSGTRLEYVKPSGEDMLQTSNDNIDHLKYANNLSATLPTGTDLTAEGLTFTFNHSILIYKVVLKNVPSDVQCGSVLSMNNYNGSETYYYNFALTLGNKSNDVFVAKGGTLTAYIPGSGYTGAFPKGTTQTFTLPAYDGIYTYTATISYEDGIKYENGKMYIANLSSIEPTVQPQINGHDWVDLGLRLSDIDESVKDTPNDRRIVFATTNIGAEKPGDLGYYFSWGDLRGITSSSIPHKSAPYNLIDNYELIDKDGNIEVCDEDYPAVGSAERWAINKIDEALDIQGHTNLRGFGYTYHKDANGNAYCTPAYYGDAATHYWGKGWVMMSKEVAGVLNTKITEQRRGTNNYDLTQSRMYLRYKNEDNTYNEVIIPHSGYLDVTEKKLAQLTNGYEMNGEYWTTKPDDGNKDQAYAVKFYSYTRGSENKTTITTSNKKNRLDARTIRPIAYLPLDSNTPDDWHSDITVPAPIDEFQRFDFGKDGWRLAIVSDEDEGFKVDLDAQETETKTITATFPKAGKATLSFNHSIAGSGEGQYELKLYVGNEVKGTYALSSTATKATLDLDVTDATQIRWEVSTKTNSSAAETHTALISGVTLKYNTPGSINNIEKTDW